MQYQILVQSLSSHLHLPEIVMDESQRFALLFDEMYLLFSPEILDTGECNINVSAALGYIPNNEDQASFYHEELLRANLLGHGTSCGYLGVSESDEISLFVIWPLQEISFAMFCDLLENFISCVEYWKSNLENLKNKKSEAKHIFTLDGMRA
jgi:hypothetical protein